MNTKENVEIIGPITLPLKIDDATLYYTLYYFDFDGKRWASAHVGSITGESRPSLRIESACFFGHVFNSQQCDCGYQLKEAFRRIAERGDGIVIYAIDQDARGLGIKTHFKIYDYRQNENLDSKELFAKLHAPLDSRSYGPVKDILNFLQVKNLTLMSNNEGRYKFLTEHGFDVVRDLIEAPMTRYNMATLMLEKEDMNYKFSFKTHSDWLKPLQERVDGDLFKYAGCVVKNNENIVAEWIGKEWDVAAHLVEAENAGYSVEDDYIVYVTDLPRIDELSVYASIGVKFVVAPFNPIPKYLQSKATMLNMKIQDWARENQYVHPRPQWLLMDEDSVPYYFREGERREIEAERI